MVLQLKDIRTKKKDSNKQIWFELKATLEYPQGCRERYKIERKFGEAKQAHELGRCRHLSQARFAIQALLAAIVLNLKRMVKLLTGVNFKGKARLAA